MECPKCHSIIEDDAKTCPHCHKVFLLECPNCHSLGEKSVCDTCGYIILTKCAKCSKINPTENEVCSKCGFPINSSLAYSECESDEFACLTFKIDALKNIRRMFKTKDMYKKFYNKTKSILLNILKSHEGKILYYDDITVVNFNKELSFSTSSNKAVRMAVKILNAFSKLNSNIQDEFSTPLKLNITITKKKAEDLQILTVHKSNIKLLNTGKNQPKYRKEMQIIMDSAVRDEIYKNFKTESLYSVEENNSTVMYYNLILESYVLPPGKEDEIKASGKVHQKDAKNEKIKKAKETFNVFDIHAKSSFETIPASELLYKLKEMDEHKFKIISIRSTENYSINTGDVAQLYEQKGYRVLSATCTDNLNYRSWGLLETIFRDYYKLSFHNKLNTSVSVNQNEYENFKTLFDLALGIPAQATTAEDARFLYFEQFANFLCSLKNTVIIIEDFPKIDDTTVQALELFFDNFKDIIPNFVFITSASVSVHSKIKKLLRTEIYKEFFLEESSMEDIVANLNYDTTEFIKSFHYKNIEDNYNGSCLYFQNAVAHLKETGALILFENKLLAKENKAVVLQNSLEALYKARIKYLNKNPIASMIIAYSTIIGARLDFKTLELLGLKDLETNAKILQDAELARVSNEVIYINNFGLVSNAVKQLLKKENYMLLLKNVLALAGKGLDSVTLASVMHDLSIHKEEYLLRWKNSQFSIITGDYDAYLKNCLSSLTIIDKLKTFISDEEIEANKKEIYNNILSYLYNYSPAKIYYIENILLMEALEQKDDEKIVKLSNLMLQGALLSSNYGDALGLLHNILSRLPDATLIVNNKVNTKFLLLSLIGIEILYNIGHFRECADTAKDILNILNENVIETSKPANFSQDIYVAHLLDTFRLAAFAKLYMLDDDLEDFLDEINLKFGSKLDEQDCIFAINDFCEGNNINLESAQDASPYAKIIYLILQEFSNLKDTYKIFAQNIYQAKLLASDISQTELELLCDLLIAYAYSQTGMTEKAAYIYEDICKISESRALFNILIVTKYLMAIQEFHANNPEKALLLINDALGSLQQQQNGMFKLLYVLFEKLYIEIAETNNITAIDIESEKNKLAPYKRSFAKFID